MPVRFSYRSFPQEPGQNDAFRVIPGSLQSVIRFRRAANSAARPFCSCACLQQNCENRLISLAMQGFGCMASSSIGFGKVSVNFMCSARIQMPADRPDRVECHHETDGEHHIHARAVLEGSAHAVHLSSDRSAGWHTAYRVNRKVQVSTPAPGDTHVLMKHRLESSAKASAAKD